MVCYIAESNAELAWHVQDEPLDYASAETAVYISLRDIGAKGYRRPLTSDLHQKRRIIISGAKAVVNYGCSPVQQHCTVVQ